MLGTASSADYLAFQGVYFCLRMTTTISLIGKILSLLGSLMNLTMELVFAVRLRFAVTGPARSGLAGNQRELTAVARAWPGQLGSAERRLQGNAGSLIASESVLPLDHATRPFF